MSQFSWTLLDDFGHQYQIGLYHGDRSKHVLIHVNRKPVVIDFSIKETKKYSFYVGQELCEMNITEKVGQYTYSFVTNREIDTPLNQARKQQSRTYFIFILLIGFILLVGIISLSYWFIALSP